MGMAGIEGKKVSAGASSQGTQTVGVAAFRPGREVWPFGRRPPNRDGNDGGMSRSMLKS